ncbi:MAG: DEAD/DEAH box helicase family protein [Sporomusaceae bacterium]|nr:DEAD/DEAH box helicase family protein [Sporomusaceae bacterium]
MVDFKKKLGKRTIEKKIHPSEIYETLDRASDKGPLRTPQNDVLNDWFENYQKEKDVILKLHTGQGKTLIGLLMLQSRLNQGHGPAVYLCPNNYLVDQTCNQADSFGISYSVSHGELPQEFIDGKNILITSVNKLFNGETKFGLGLKSLKVPTILMDDSHTCIETIKEACKITLKNDRQAYHDILELFGAELEKQGVGTYADLINNDYDALLPVPYWDWQDKHVEIANILSRNKDLKEIKFAWPILKNIIRDCQCIISGAALEIAPYSVPLHLFGSFYNASHRVFMSATVSDDAFFVKGLGLNAKAIQTPLCYKNEKWSGEKMVLIPSLIDESLDRAEIVSKFAKPTNGRSFGVVALTPSFKGTRDWAEYKSIIATKETINQEIGNLKVKKCENTLIIVNRYDGIDLPDSSCRILILDSKPYSESLIERYIESCLSNSDVIAIKTAQTIEQGMGRAVRGEKDYCAILLIGTDLIKFIRSNATRRYFSQQTRTQIEIGIEVAEFAKDEIKSGLDQFEALKNLINQLLKRDEGWKDYYTEMMDSMPRETKGQKIINQFEAEKKAEEKYNNGDYLGAADVIQRLIDKEISSEEEKGWYLQEKARYYYAYSKVESNKVQVAAHKKNRYLLKPRDGMVISKLTPISFKRVENIVKWIHQFEKFDDLVVEVDNILSSLRFGVKADNFEQAFDNLAKVLGFISERPDKEWKEGPDNLWKVRDNQYLLVECKNCVELTRGEICKEETGQMNNASAWFERNYGELAVKRIMIIPTKKVSRAAGFNDDVEIMREKSLKALAQNVRKFFFEFKNTDLNDLSEQRIQELLKAHKLMVEDLLIRYSEKPKYY